MNKYCPNCAALLPFYQDPSRICDSCGWQQPVNKPAPLTVKEIMSDAYTTWIEKGWADSNINFPEQCMLIVSELAEAVEEYRKHGVDTGIKVWDGKPEGIATELADVVLRVFNLCSHFVIPLEEAITLKAAYNKTRSYKHGGKLV